MVRRLVSIEDAERLQRWFLQYMRDEDFEPDPDKMPQDRRYRPVKGLIGATQLCNAAGVNIATTRMFNKDPYVPFPEYLRKLVLALRQMLQELGHPRWREVTVIRAYLEAGYLTEWDVLVYGGEEWEMQK